MKFEDRQMIRIMWRLKREIPLDVEVRVIAGFEFSFSKSPNQSKMKIHTNEILSPVLARREGEGSVVRFNTELFPESSIDIRVCSMRAYDFLEDVMGILSELGYEIDVTRNVNVD